MIWATRSKRTSSRRSVRSVTVAPPSEFIAILLAHTTRSWSRRHLVAFAIVVRMKVSRLPPSGLTSGHGRGRSSAMLTIFLALVQTLKSMVSSRADLLLEIAALRQQLEVYRRQTARPRIRRSERMFWIWLCRAWPRWRSALVFVKPETVLAWHRAGYRKYWWWRSRGRGRPRIPRRHIAFIRRISADHPDWGEDRIALELRLKLGVEHGPSTIRRYMVEGTGRPNSTWRSFLARNASDIWAMDFTTERLWNFEVRYVLVVIALDTRRVVDYAATALPTLAWVKQQLREAMPWEQGPRFLIHDNDGIFGQFGRIRRGATGKGYRCALDGWLDQVMGVRGIPIPYGAPNANAVLERFMGTLRRECLNHFLFMSERQLRCKVDEFVGYYNHFRPHQGIDGIPDRLPCSLDPPPNPESGRLVARPVLGGVHHDYRLAA